MTIRMLGIFLIVSAGTARMYTGIESEKKHADIFCIVLAGGYGERLWPLSRQERPKPFLSLIDNKSLLEATFDRLNGVKGTKHYWVVTTQALEHNVHSLLGERIERILIEPSRRNTGPAILLSCLEIMQKSPQAFVVFLPSDAYIPDAEVFSQALNTVIDTTKESSLALLGIKPTYPATGYGYIKYDTSVNSGVASVLGFYEKPPLEKAREYFNASDMLWNTGIFCGTVTSFIDHYRLYAPELYDKMIAFKNGLGSYEEILSTSIDYAVLEKSTAIAVLPVKLEWSDIGNIRTFLTLWLKHNQSSYSLVSVGSEHNLISTKKKMVALIDVHGLCIVDTDDVLLISQCDSAEENVKVIVEDIKKQGRTVFL